MAGTIIDTLTTVFNFKTDTSGLVKAEHEVDKFKHKTEQANEVLEFLRRGIEVVGIAFGLEKINEWANEWDNAQNKLRSVGLTGQELAETMQQLKDIASNSGTSIESVTELYQQLDTTMGEMVGKQGLLTMVDNLNKVFAINATEAGSAKAAMMDMAKGLENTTVNWMEIKRAMMDVPGLANIINKHFKAMGTTTAEALEGGKFASADFVKILIDAKDEIDKQFKATANTVPRAMQALVNSFSEFFSVLRQNSGITDFMINGLNGIATALDWLSSQMKTHANAMQAIGITLAGIFTTLAIRMAIAFLPVIIEFGLIALAIGAVILVLDDFITFMKGGDSVIGDMIAAITKWWQTFAASHPAIAQVVETIKEFALWIGNLIAKFFESGEASAIFGQVIDIIGNFLNITISILKILIALIGEFFEILANLGKALGNVAFDAVQAIIKMWDKFKDFRDWLINVFAKIGKFLLSPFENMAEAILAPINRVLNWIKGTSIGKWVAGKLGLDTDIQGANRQVANDQTPTVAKQFSNILTPTVGNLRENEQRQIALSNFGQSFIPNNLLTPTINGQSSVVSDNSTNNITINMPEGVTHEQAKKMISDGMAQHKQNFRTGVLNNDSRIAR